jgi:superfamily II DNA or RNA helicase
MDVENMSTSSLTMIQAIEALNWSETKETYTKKGIYRVKSLSPVPSIFWNFWKEAQAILEKQGYAMRKHNGIWYALRFYELARPETMQRLVEESRGVDTDARLLVPPGLAYRPFQRQGIKYCIDRLFGQNGMSERDGVLIADQPGLGKLCDVNTPTLTPTGWKKLGELAVGDQVINADGCASTVTGVFPQGVKAIYKIKFSDGTETNSGLEHLWEVRDSNMKARGRGWSARTLGEIMRRGVLGKDGKGKWEVPQFPGHMETHREAPKIDGWLLGQLIGNGYTNGGDGTINVASNNEDKDVIARLESLGGQTRFDACAKTRFSIERCGRMMDELRKLNLNCKSKEKSIHESLLVTPWEYRVKLLQGLMDSNGSNRRNRIAFHTCSRNLAESVAQLVRSLGGCAIVREYGRAPEGKPTEWSVNVQTPFCPFWSQRKSKGWKADPRNRGNKIVAVTYSHDAEAVCIMVDHPRHLYVTENYKLTHNTVQFLGIINQDPNMLQTKSLIVCPATLKLNWRNEARRWLLDGFGYSAVVTKDRWPGDLKGAGIVITNYDVLHKFAKEIRRTRWDYVCFDEAHYLKNENARRTIFALGGAAKMAEQHMVVSSIPTKKTIFLTGTPVENGKAGELINIIEKCDPNGLGANRSKFIDRYQRTDEYLEELQTQMRMRFMVRRLKHEVLKELPPKVRQVIPIDPDECGKEAVIFGEEMRLFKEYQECLKEWAVKTELAKAEGVSCYREVLKAKKASIGMTAGQLARLRKRTALAKVDGVIAQVREIVSDGDPLILFAHHIEVLDRLEEALKKAKISVVRVDGSTPLPMRQKAVEDFQAGKFTVFLGGLKPCGVGITLTKASKVAFVELDWLPGKMEQAEDRAHRIGKEETVMVFHLVIEGSLDEYMAKRLIEKQEKIDRTLDSQSQYDEEDEDDEDEDDERNSFAAPDRAASKGITAEKLEDEAARMTDDMLNAAGSAIHILVEEKLERLNGTDRAIAVAIVEGAFDKKRMALARKIAMRYAILLDTEMVERMKWPKPQTEK